MRRILTAVVLVCAVLLSGCVLEDLIDQILGDGGEPGGGGIGGVTWVQAIVEYDFSADVERLDTGVELMGIFASIGSIGSLVFDASTNTYTATTPIGSDPYVQITITLDYAGSMITYLHAFRRMSHGFDTWERIDQIVAYDIPYDRFEGSSDFYRIDAADVMWSGLEMVDYKDWSKAIHTEQNPMYRMVNPSGAQTFFDNDPDRYLEIEFRQ